MRRLAIAIMLSACTSSERHDLTGFVSVSTEGGDATYVAAGQAAASFDAPDVRAPMVRSIGACDVFTYDVPSTFSSAGVIMINGGLTGVKLAPSSNGRYEAVIEDYQFFQGDETLTVQAHGAAVAAFSTTLRAPGPVTITSPPLAMDAMGNFTTPHGQPLMLQWTSTASTVQLSASPIGYANDQSVRIVCRFPGEAGSGIVPAEALASVDSDTPVQFFIESANDTAVTVGDWDVEVSATLGAYWTPTQLAQGMFVFQ